MSSIVNKSNLTYEKFKKSGISQDELKKQLHQNIKDDIKKGMETALEEIKKLQLDIEPEFFFQYIQDYQDIYKSLAVLQHHNLMPPKLALLYIKRFVDNLKKEHYNEWNAVKRDEWFKFCNSLL